MVDGEVVVTATDTVLLLTLALLLLFLPFLMEEVLNKISFSDTGSIPIDEFLMSMLWI